MQPLQPRVPVGWSQGLAQLLVEVPRRIDEGVAKHSEQAAGACTEEGPDGVWQTLVVVRVNEHIDQSCHAVSHGRGKFHVSWKWAAGAPMRQGSCGNVQGKHKGRVVALHIAVDPRPALPQERDSEEVHRGWAYADQLQSRQGKIGKVSRQLDEELTVGGPCSCPAAHRRRLAPHP